MTDLMLFAVFPYVALVLAVAGGVYRYYSDRFTYSSLSSQFLEDRQLFYGSVPWHYGIIIILLAHLFAALFPGRWAVLIGEPVRLYTLEITGMALGFLTVVGIVLLIVRRLSSRRLLAVTSVMDWVLLIDLLIQVALGVYIALFYRWGAMWYLHTAAPWFSSLARLDPQVQHIASLPFLAKTHFFNAFVLIGLFPFTRLVHLVTVPISYLWRPYQLVIWNRREQA